MSTDKIIPPGAPAPRLCHIVKWLDYDEYGFNLHAEKAKTGQFIGKVDEGSPAFYAGLLEGDRIIEVNEVNIANENHKQVVERVKTYPNETKLLVLDDSADKWYKERKIIVKSSQDNVLYKKTPPVRPTKENNDSVRESNGGINEIQKEPVPPPATMELSTEAPAPRLCHIIKWSSSDDYGFNLHADKNVNGQYIGKVDDGSPAALAGLRENDRIIEVNNNNVANEGHKQLVERIKLVPNETKLLVLDELSEKWYRERKLVARSTQPNVIYGRTPPKKVQTPTSPANHALNGDATEVRERSPLPDDAPAPRLCHMYKWPDFDGYGFTLHAEKHKNGQYIGKIDPDSPAEYAGLLEGDRIIEVNGKNTGTEGHRQLVERIKTNANETKLLVIDEVAERWYTQNSLVPSGSQSNVIYMQTPFPRPQPIIEDHHRDYIKDERPPSVVEEAANSTRSSSPLSKTDTLDSATGSIQDSPRSTKSAHSQNGVTTSATPSPDNNNQTTTTATINNNLSSSTGELNLNMSVSEMRQMLANRKKFDPKKTTMDLRQKYNIIQEM